MNRAIWSVESVKAAADGDLLHETMSDSGSLSDLLSHHASIWVVQTVGIPTEINGMMKKLKYELLFHKLSVLLWGIFGHLESLCRKNHTRSTNKTLGVLTSVHRLCSSKTQWKQIKRPCHFYMCTECNDLKHLKPSRCFFERSVSSLMVSFVCPQRRVIAAGRLFRYVRAAARWKMAVLKEHRAVKINEHRWARARTHLMTHLAASSLLLDLPNRNARAPAVPTCKAHFPSLVPHCNKLMEDSQESTAQGHGF